MCPSAELVQWSVSRADDEVAVALVGEVDLSNAAALGRALAEVVEMKPARIAVDLAGVSFLDSTGSGASSTLRSRPPRPGPSWWCAGPSESCCECWRSAVSTSCS